MKIEFEFERENSRWLLIQRDDEAVSEHHFSSRRKALLSIFYNRIPLYKTGDHFKITVEVENGDTISRATG